MRRIVKADFTFVTTNARDFRKLYAKEELHAGLVIIIPQLLPALQREIFTGILEELGNEGEFVNEVIEVTIDDGAATLTRYALPDR